jgi:hypothetical protein
MAVATPRTYPVPAKPIGQFEPSSTSARTCVAAESAKSAYAAAAAITENPDDLAEIIAVVSSVLEACLLAGHENIESMAASASPGNTRSPVLQAGQVLGVPVRRRRAPRDPRGRDQPVNKIGP